MMSQSAPTPTLGYIADGLVFHLDGIARGGETGKWKSLVGDSVFTLPTSFTEEINAVVTPGGTGSQNSAYPSVDTDVRSNIGTIEVCCEVLQTGSGCIISANRGYLCFIVAGTGYTFDADSSVYNQWNVTKETLFTASASMTRFAYNGVITGTAAKNGWGGASERIGNMGVSYGMKARIYSIRKYNRILTEYEMKYNQWVDDQRFNLGLGLVEPINE